MKKHSFLSTLSALALVLSICSASAQKKVPGKVTAMPSTTSKAVVSDAAEWRKQFTLWSTAYSQGQFQSAEEILQVQLAKIDKDQAKYQKYLGETLTDLIKTKFALKKYDETKTLYERLLNVVRQQYGASSTEMAKTLKSYSLICRRLGENEKAAQLQSQAESILQNPVVLAPKGTTPRDGSVSDLKESEFSSLVASSKLPVLVDFYADWCGPCRHMSPLVEAAARSYSGRIRVFRCNVDSNPNLASQFGINSIPTFIVFRAGKRAANFTGTMSQEELNKFVELGLH